MSCDHWRMVKPHFGPCESSLLSGYLEACWFKQSDGFFCSFPTFRSDNKVTVHFVNRDGEKITVKGSPGDSLLDVVINEDLDIDGFGA